MNWPQYLKILGGVFVVTGLVIFGLTYYPVAKLEVTYVSNSRPATAITPINTTLGIVIPKIGANASIIKDVDPFNSAVYQRALTQGVAHAKGTALPGDQGNSFLFSHSSVDFFEAMKYNSVFYLLSKLEPGDPIYIYRNNQKLTFVVAEKKLVAAEAVDYLSSTDSKPALTLMTCWPPGTTLKRLMVKAIPQTQ